MNLSEDQKIDKYAKECGHCRRNTLLPYDYEYICVSCGNNVIKRKHEHSKIHKKLNFVNRLKYAEHKKFCICIQDYKIDEGNDYGEIYEVLATLKNEILKMNTILIEKCEDLLENPELEHHYFSRTAIGIYKIGHDSIRLMKLLFYYDRSYYENI